MRCVKTPLLGLVRCMCLLAWTTVLVQSAPRLGDSIQAPPHLRASSSLASVKDKIDNWEEASSTSFALSNQTLRVGEPEDIGKKLDERWASQLDIWKRGAYNGAATKGVDSLKDVGSLLTNPTLGSAATFLQDAGTIAGLLPFPPESQVIGIGLYAIGGIMSLFDSTPAEPSNSDVIASITSAFDSLSREIHVVEKQVDVVIAAVAHLQATVEVLGEAIQALYQDIHLRYLTMNKIDSVYVASMEQLGYAQQDPTLVGDFQNYVKKQRTILADEVYNSMAPSKIRESLTNSINHGGNCIAALTFKWHMTTRWKLYWIMLMGSFFANGVSPQIEGYSKQLKQDLSDYMQIATDLQIGGLVKLQDTELGKCLDMPHKGDYSHTDNRGNEIVPDIVPGLDMSNGCGTNFEFVGRSSTRFDCYNAGLEAGLPASFYNLKTVLYDFNNTGLAEEGCYAVRSHRCWSLTGDKSCYDMVFWNTNDPKEGMPLIPAEDCDCAPPKPTFVPVCKKVQKR